MMRQPTERRRGWGRGEQQQRGSPAPSGEADNPDCDQPGSGLSVRDVFPLLPHRLPPPPELQRPL